MKIRFGYREIEYPSAEMGELRDSNGLLGNSAALHERIQTDGYLLLRGLIDRDKVLRGRHTILAYMDEKGALTPGAPMLDGVMPNGGRSVQMMGNKGIAHSGDVLSVIESEELFDFFGTYFGEEALSFHYKWLRAVGNEQYTGAHMDFVYMGRGSTNLHTVWIPFGDTPVEHGTLAICVGSNHLASFGRIRGTYGRMDVDRDVADGWFTRDPLEITEQYGGEWKTTEFQAGDVILFGMHTMHASTTNLTNRFRLSCDVRYQPASEPADQRWIKNGTAHTAHGITKLRSIEELRAEWAV